MEVRKLYSPTIRAMGPGATCVLWEEHQAAMAEIRAELEAAKARLVIYENAVITMGPLIANLQRNNAALEKELRIKTNDLQIQTAQNLHGQNTIEELRTKLKDGQLDLEYAQSLLSKFVACEP